jgi:hypothetical protein
MDRFIPARCSLAVYTFVPFLPKHNNQSSVVEAIAVSVTVAICVAVLFKESLPSPTPDMKQEILMISYHAIVTDQARSSCLQRALDLYKKTYDRYQI